MPKQKAWNTQRTADGLCLLVAVIWGSGFIASQLAIDSGMGSSLIMALRFSLAALVMLLFCARKLRRLRMREIRPGMVAGLLLFGAFFTQIVGQRQTTVSHSAFLTATNVVMVPFLVWLVKRRAPSVRTFFCAAAALAGIAVLSFQPEETAFSFGFGDMMTLLCALLFALHITVLGQTEPDADAMLLNLVQLAVAAVISAAVFFLTDAGSVSVDWSMGLPAAVYLGLFSTCLCYFLQTWAQKYTTPSQAGVLLACEGLFGSLFSVLLGLEPLTLQMAAGGLIILGSVVFLELAPSGGGREPVQDGRKK